jgi:hypothetical protein
MNKHTLALMAACATSLGVTAHAQSLQHELTHHAAQQSRIAAEEAHGKLAPNRLAALHEQAAAVELTEANVLSGNADAAAVKRLARTEHDLDRAIARAEHPSRAQQQHAAGLDRMHTRVAATREAQQQQWIAAQFRHGTLDREQAARLERAQADITQQQAALQRRGRESVDEALQMQHRQDVQDWQIRSGRSQA